MNKTAHAITMISHVIFMQHVEFLELVAKSRSDTWLNFAEELSIVANLYLEVDLWYMRESD